MSLEGASGNVCYVHCNFCSITLAVAIPSKDSFNIVTVRCGHCSNLMSVNMGALLRSFPHQDPQGKTSVAVLQERSNISPRTQYYACNEHTGSSSSSHAEDDQYQMSSARRKRQRVPSAYNKFIKEEIQRIKASNPNIGHREAFSAAAKNWAHFPRIHFSGLNERSKQDEGSIVRVL